jgi:hypothetical protein
LKFSTTNNEKKKKTCLFQHNKQNGTFQFPRIFFIPVTPTNDIATKSLLARNETPWEQKLREPVKDH